ncbi:MAG: hypothetical protein ACX94C_05565 [Phycisphaerales bacterium]
MRRTVVLLHTQPQKPDHYDWLIDQPELDTQHRLITFRTAHSPDQADAFLAQQAPDHRAMYLDYEGPLSNNRGQVSQVASGHVHIWEQHRDQITCRIQWAERLQDLTATRSGDGWRFAQSGP